MTILSKYYGFWGNLKIIYKWALSFLKSHWSIEDYPILTKMQTGVEDNSKWCARIMNWETMIGLGKTKEKSLLNLKTNFSEWIRKNHPIHRPGEKVALKFAEDKLINKYPDLLNDFLSRVIEIDTEKILYISDITSMYDFLPEEKKREYVLKIKRIYSVDVSDIKDGNIAKILNRISKARL